MAKQLAVRIGCGSFRRLDDRPRKHTLRQVVVALETFTRGSGDAPCPEQPFEGMLGVAPAPPAAGTLVAVEAGSGDRTVGLDLAVDALDIVCFLAGEPRQRAVGADTVHRAAHAPAHQ